MKKMSDEELQKLLDDNKLLSNAGEATSDDAEAYHLLFDILDTEPAQGLPYDFSAKVTRRIQAEAKRSNELRIYLISLAVFAVVVAVVGLLISLVKPGGKAFVYLNII